MDQSLFPIFCILSIIALSCSARFVTENDSNEPSGGSDSFVHKVRDQLQKSPQLQKMGSLAKMYLNSVEMKYRLQHPEGFLQNSTQCLKDVYYIKQNINKLWAMELIDSIGKPGSGVLYANYIWPGDYIECIGVRSSNPKSSTVGNFRGKYCAITVSLPLQNLPLKIGVCVPDSCSDSDVRDLKEKMADFLPINDTFPGLRHGLIHSKIEDLQCQPRVRHLTTEAKITIAIISIICTVTVLGSAITVARYLRKEFPPAIQAVNDFGEHLAIENGEYTPQKIESFQATKPQDLLLEMLPETDILPFQLVIQAPFSMDTFFVLSGFLLTYLSTKRVFDKKQDKEKRSISWAYFYMHRLLRITPAYMMVLAFLTTLYNYLGSGPFWPVEDTDPVCKEKWWMHLLYIDNFEEDTHCMGWSWFLANNMQYFVISPVFLILLWKSRKIGFFLIFATMGASSLVTMHITYRFNFGANPYAAITEQMQSLQEGEQRFKDYFEIYFSKPYARIGSYLIGMLLGYTLYMRKTRSNHKHGLTFLCVGWSLAVSSSLACVFGLHRRHPSMTMSCLYNAFSHNIFSLAVSWVIYVCFTGQGGLVNRILSVKVFIPLSRLTYSAYLIHPLIIYGYFQSLRQPELFTHSTMISLYLGFTFLTYTLAIPVSLMLESPIMALEKLTFATEQGKDAVN